MRDNNPSITDLMAPFYRRDGRTWPLLLTEYADKAGGLPKSTARGRLKVLREMGLITSTLYKDGRNDVNIYEVSNEGIQQGTKTSAEA